MDDARSAADVTRLLVEAREGAPQPLERLMSAVYEELRAIARRQLSRERADHTLDGTALVHEAYVKLAGGNLPEWRDRAHFFGVAARSMRQVLVDHARASAAGKRGGGWERTSLTNVGLGFSVALEDVVALDRALDALGALDPRMRSVVEYRFFAGLEEKEVAELLGVTVRTVQRDWVRARAWLHNELHGAGAGE